MLTAWLLAILAISIAVGAPIAVSLGLTAVGYFLLKGQASFLFLVAQRLFAGCNSFELIAIPLFVLSGDLMLDGAISKALVDLAKSMFGWVRGNLALTTTLGSMLFGAVSGSGPATASAIGSIVAEPMAEEGYPRAYTSAVIAASSPLGSLIPPSILMVVYGAASGASIAKMLMSGIGPGILFGVLFMVYEIHVGRRAQYGSVSPFSLSQFLVALRKGVWALIAPVIILGGIYSGIFTPTEAAAVTVFYSLFVGMVVNRTIKLKNLPSILLRSGVTSGAILFVLGTVAAFGYVITREGIPQQLTIAATSIIKTPIMFLIVSQVILVVAGMLMNGSAAIMLLVPLFLPTVRQYGIDPVYFGGLMVANLSIGMYTPPVAVTSYVASRIAGASFDETNRALVPFLVVSFIAIVILLLVPGIITFLPHYLLD
ncbi:TRAP transporter large permease [Aminobacterium colombiense]|uniref:TRAP dicarboxylate transporter, DctM subunit n=1 Tax=Aminobacterium colombiense (strain DSM 12261 / ALA-1) TaxID=572547 RepID=D5ECJ8_AMICL|nr:TRAP transporter large permease [Aminobacterium colombiense]ADE56280.1 TRAP dicarboxylate transporter, DctM subunit [Aminobacterium colombiense DSM 12261]